MPQRPPRTPHRSRSTCIAATAGLLGAACSGIPVGERSDSGGSVVPESARALFRRARGPKKLIWKDTGHMDLFDREVVRGIVAEVVRELRDVGILD